MTSKELLEEIRKDYNWETSDCEIGAYFQNYFEQIAKDLEVLDIIKKHIVSKLFEYGTNFDSYNKISLIAEIIQMKDFTSESTGIHYTAIKTDNDFEIIREWLENNKQ